MEPIRKLFAKGRLGEVFGGCLTISIGLWIRSFEDGAFYSRGFPVPRIVWILIVFLGLGIIVHAFKNRKTIKSEYNFVKCNNCKSSFYEAQAPNDICPNCGHEVEQIDGYFERHLNEKPVEDIKDKSA
ncbi:MAG: hypothetical protein PVH87_14500 [Desulfobacteraceae bacterium]|jgi:ssDNA-binding Zn-finger/Zn-ribbon topoisomerase 1